MNQLSWLIYLADVSGSAGGWLTAVSTVAGAATIITLCLCCISSADASDEEYGDAEDEVKTIWSTGWRVMNWSMPLFFICLLLSILTPSRGTIMAIAASEVGEEVLNSPTAAKATRALEAWIEAQLPDVTEQPNQNNQSNNNESN